MKKRVTIASVRKQTFNKHRIIIKLNVYLDQSICIIDSNIYKMYSKMWFEVNN